MRLCPEHVSVQTSGELARRLFKASVAIVEVEISSYCNRTCRFCPNSLVDRRSNPQTMDADLFTSIVDQLRRINYDGAISLHRYNEPLADRAHVLACIRQIRERLPLATIRIFTNGDYLDRDYLDELYGAGCRFVRASLYAAQEEYDDDAMAARLRERVARLGYPFAFHRMARKAVAKIHMAPDMSFDYSTLDYLGADEGAPVLRAVNRGGALAINEGYTRTSPCFIPFTELQVEWDGSLQACCNLRADLPEQAPYTLATLTPESDLFVAWCGRKYVEWRRALASWERKTGPCASCHFSEVRDTPQLREALRLCRTWFAADG